jgi:hypothetical protein
MGSGRQTQSFRGPTDGLFTTISSLRWKKVLYSICSQSGGERKG